MFECARYRVMLKPDHKDCVRAGAMDLPYQVERFVAEGFGWIPVSSHENEQDARAALEEYEG